MLCKSSSPIEGYSKDKHGFKTPAIRGKFIFSYWGSRFVLVESSENYLFSLVLLPFFFSENGLILNSSNSLFQDGAICKNNITAPISQGPQQKAARAVRAPFLQWERGLHPGNTEPLFQPQLINNTLTYVGSRYRILAGVLLW